VVLTCNGVERSRCIFLEESVDGIDGPFDDVSNYVGLTFHGDCYCDGTTCIRDEHDYTEWIYNVNNIISIKNTYYKVYVRDTEEEGVEDVH
jgi:hypothetical protein